MSKNMNAHINHMPHTTGLFWRRRARKSTHCTPKYLFSSSFYYRSFFSCGCCQRGIVYVSDERANSILPIEKLQGEKFGSCGYGTVCITTGIPLQPSTRLKCIITFTHCGTCVGMGASRHLVPLKRRRWHRTVRSSSNL